MARKYAIAVTGTPGTGKTTFSKMLAKELGAELIDLNALIKKSRIYEIDEDGTRAVDPKDLCVEFLKAIKSVSGSFVVEGLLAHLLPKTSLTHIVVTRTHPMVLRKRLKKRKYSDTKIRENLGAEALDIILWEAVKNQGKERVYELDTTNCTAHKTVQKFINALKNKKLLKPGQVNWLEAFYVPKRNKRKGRSLKSL